MSPAVNSQWLACSRASLRAGAGAEQLGSRHEQLDGRQLPAVGQAGVRPSDALRGQLRAAAEVGPQLVEERAIRIVDRACGGGMECAEPARRQVIEHRGADKRVGDVDDAPAAADLQLDQPVPRGPPTAGRPGRRRRSCARARRARRRP